MVVQVLEIFSPDDVFGVAGRCGGDRQASWSDRVRHAEIGGHCRAAELDVGP